jgi:hypothetical protein
MAITEEAPMTGGVTMKLITVRAKRDGDKDDDEGRLYITIAPDGETAVKLAKPPAEHNGERTLEVESVVEGTFDGPSRLLGYCGGDWRT